MPPICNRIRIPNKRGELLLSQGGQIEYRASQIFIWLSISRYGRSKPTSPPFPVLLDTGFNGYFLMDEEQTSALQVPVKDLAAIRSSKSMELDRIAVPTFDADLWLYPNRDGAMECDIGAVPVRLEIPRLVFVPPGNQFREYKWPLLGLSGIRAARLTVRFDHDFAGIDR